MLCLFCSLTQEHDVDLCSKFYAIGFLRAENFEEEYFLYRFYMRGGPYNEKYMKHYKKAWDPISNKWCSFYPVWLKTIYHLIYELKTIEEYDFLNKYSIFAYHLCELPVRTSVLWMLNVLINRKGLKAFDEIQEKLTQSPQEFL